MIAKISAYKVDKKGVLPKDLGKYFFDYSEDNFVETSYTVAFITDEYLVKMLQRANYFELKDNFELSVLSVKNTLDSLRKEILLLNEKDDIYKLRKEQIKLLDSIYEIQTCNLGYDFRLKIISEG